MEIAYYALRSNGDLLNAASFCSREKMGKKTVVGIAHSGADLGKPAEYTRDQLAMVKAMIKSIADQTMGGMQNIVKAGDKVLIKINTVIPVPANAGFTTDPRMLEALIGLVQEQNPGRIQIGERCAMGAATMEAMRVCGIVEVAERTSIACRSSIPRCW